MASNSFSMKNVLTVLSLATHAYTQTAPLGTGVGTGIFPTNNGTSVIPSGSGTGIGGTGGTGVTVLPPTTTEDTSPTTTDEPPSSTTPIFPTNNGTSVTPSGTGTGTGGTVLPPSTTDEDPSTTTDEQPQTTTTDEQPQTTTTDEQPQTTTTDEDPQTTTDDVPPSTTTTDDVPPSTTTTDEVPPSTTDEEPPPSTTEEGDPSTTTTDVVPITTFSVFPSDEVSTLSDTTITSGSHIDQTTTDDSGETHVAAIPILPDVDHGCWFCPPGAGFALTGFALPGVYPGGGPPAGFPTPFPPITIGPNGDPTFESSKPTDEPTKTDDPTTTDGPTTTDDPTTTEESTTETSTSTSTSEDSCALATFASDSPLPIDEDEDAPVEDEESEEPEARIRLRGMARRRAKIMAEAELAERKASLAERAPAPGGVPPRRLVSVQGKCTLSSEDSGGNQVAATVTLPDHPKAGEMEAHNPAGAIFWYVPTMTGGLAGCPTSSMTKFDNLADLTANVFPPYPKTYVTTKPKATDEPSVNSDHVWEITLLKAFMDSLQTDQNNPDCAVYNDFLMKPNSKDGGKLRLETLYNLLPGNDHPDVVGMDSRINQAKGWLFSPNLQEMHKPSQKRSDQAVLEAVWQVGLALQFMHITEVTDLFKKSNSRIYNALRGLDNLANSGCDAGFQRNYADAFSNFMESTIDAQNKAISATVDAAVSNKQFKGKTSWFKTTTDTDDPTKPNSIGLGLQAFEKAFPKDMWGFDKGALLDWSTNDDPLEIAKRQDDNSGAQCTPGTTTGPATTEATPTDEPTTADGPTTTDEQTPTPTTTTTSEETPPPTQTSDPARCDACSTNMGASDCGPDDDQCLIDQCSADEDCKACGIDCNTFVQDPVSTSEEPPPETTTSEDPPPETTTEAPPPEPTCPESNDDHWPSCDECPGWDGPSFDLCVAGEGPAACNCPDPCGDTNCIY